MPPPVAFLSTLNLSTSQMAFSCACETPLGGRARQAVRGEEGDASLGPPRNDY